MWVSYFAVLWMTDIHLTRNTKHRVVKSGKAWELARLWLCPNRIYVLIQKHKSALSMLYNFTFVSNIGRLLFSCVIFWLILMFM